jgi:hypothetical protein
MIDTEKRPPDGWASAWPDALAFVAGLALAWFGQWQTKDLVWSLWLSSLLVGYAMIVWNIFGPVAVLVRSTAGKGAPLVAEAGLDGVFLAGGLFLLAFFTVHFGMFHFVHSVFLNSFFPVLPGKNSWPGVALYLQVLRDYWPFVLVAAVAERSAFGRPVPLAPATDNAVTAGGIALRKSGLQGGDGMMTPYRNVIRLHLLIFFFAFASFAKLHSFLVYAVVYAVYFFPWRLVKRDKG